MPKGKSRLTDEVDIDRLRCRALTLLLEPELEPGLVLELELDDNGLPLLSRIVSSSGFFLDMRLD